MRCKTMGIFFFGLDGFRVSDFSKRMPQSCVVIGCTRLFIHSYIYLCRIAEKQGWMLIKATLLTELPEKKKKRERREGQKRKDKKNLKCTCVILRQDPP